jgi:hypothetical protein
MARRLRVGVALLYMGILAAAANAQPDAPRLREETVTAFERYVSLTEARMDAEARGEGPALWVDGLPEPRRREAYAKLRRGEIVVSRLETRDAGRRIDVPGGLSHHWVGTVLAAGADLDRTVALMQAYDGYHEMYRPAVRRSRTLSRDGQRFRVYLRLFMKKIVTVVLDTEYDVRYVALSPSRMRVHSISTRIAEIRRPDTPEEEEKPIGRDNGFLWRLNNYCALEQREGGTFIQCESVSLSRDIPTGLGWLIRPFVTSIPRESLEFTLGALRAAAMAGR